jgi:UDP-N-acetylmuramoylalanine--D-glutamate ligase
MDFRGRRVTVVGLGIEGVDAVRFFVGRGAHVTVSDAKGADQLGRRLAQIQGLPVRLSLGGNDPQVLCEADYLFVSQGVPLELPGIVEARRRGVPLLSMLGLFLEMCPGPVAGITGSSGKTTTTALLGEMFRYEGLPHVVGGNIGVGLLELLPRVRPYTWVVLEISHTQLQLTGHSPHVAAVLNITPNHLDRFSWEQYRALKANILRYQGPGDWAVLGYDCAESRALADRVASRVLFFSLGEAEGDGVFARDGQALWRCGRRQRRLFPLAAVRLRGQHNLQNALAAAAMACACGLSPESIARAVATFRGVEHRLEPVATVGGVQFYNDSIATTPERTLAGLRCFDQPLVLLLGGRDKHLPLAELAEEACRRCRGVVFFGESGPKLQEAVAAAASRLPPEQRPALVPARDLEEAVAAAWALARPGDVVLLSPACTSFDAYENFEERGRHFRALVEALAKEGLPSPT